MRESFARVGVMVAHPDDETLWAGGWLLMTPPSLCYIAAACRASDPDRAPKFQRVLAEYGADGQIADLDDGQAQDPLPDELVRETVLDLLGEREFDVLLTHGPQGEYTRHLRHNEISRAVISLWREGCIRARELWHFAYEDGDRSYLPRARADADMTVMLAESIWEAKYRIVHELYGFSADSWEARATPRTEAFARLTMTASAKATTVLDDSVSNCQ